MCPFTRDVAFGGLQLSRKMRLLYDLVNRFFMKLFRTSDISVIAYCREMFQFDLPSASLKKRAEKFDSVSLN